MFCSVFPFSFSFGSTGVSTPDLMFARQVFYYLSHDFSLFLYIFFWNNLAFFFQGLAWTTVLTQVHATIPGLFIEIGSW
jgi:hypothetical protein